MSEFGQMNFNQTFNPNFNNMAQFPNFNNFSNCNTSFINNNLNTMQYPNNMMMNSMFNNTNNNFFPSMNMMNMMSPNFGFRQMNQMIGGNSFQNQMPNNYNMMFNNMNNINNMQNTMNNFQFNNNQIINNINNFTVNCNNNLSNSMNNIQPSFNMTNPMDNMNLNNNMNMMNNNLYNSMNMNMNFSNFPNNDLNLINTNSKNSLSNSFNNLSTTKLKEDFNLEQSMGGNIYNTMKPIHNDIINMIFRFRTGETFHIKGKMNDKLSNIISEFKKTQCPEMSKNELFYCLHNGSKLNLEKTLKESNINSNDIILIITNDAVNKDIKEEKKVNSEINTETNLSNSSPSGIIVKEHIHNLVYCLTNFIWKCNLCSNKYEKTSPKYFCSVCNYSMCENCHAIRNYPKKKAFPDDIDTSEITIKKKFLKTVYHKHILVYSRTSRDSTEYKQWFCNNCKTTFENDVWSFYCTKCDFDLCKICAGFT